MPTLARISDLPVTVLRHEQRQGKGASLFGYTSLYGSVPGGQAVALVRAEIEGMAPADACRRVCRWVSEAMEYVPGATGVHTSAEEAWEVRKGVCQDMAHLTVGLLRGLDSLG